MSCPTDYSPLRCRAWKIVVELAPLRRGAPSAFGALLTTWQPLIRSQANEILPSGAWPHLMP
jgi:hypothetical protein